jgi:hypothetical protein
MININDLSTLSKADRALADKAVRVILATIAKAQPIGSYTIDFELLEKCIYWKISNRVKAEIIKRMSALGWNVSGDNKGNLTFNI